MTEYNDYRSLYQAYLEHCNNHDFGSMASFYSPSIRVNGNPMDPAKVAEQFAPIIAAFPDWHWDIRHIVTDDETIVVHFAVTGTHRGTFQGVEATGRRFEISEFTLYRVEQGKFAEVWDLLDMDALMKQIG